MLSNKSDFLKSFENPKIRCLDDFRPVLSALPLQNCAVVGSSDLLRFYPMGEQINSAGTIWRVNHSPVSGFEALVGNRTDVRIMNHVWSDVKTCVLKPKVGEFSEIGNEIGDYKRMCHHNSYSYSECEI